MTSSNGNILRVTGHLCGEFTGDRWIPRIKASDAELWWFFHLRLNKRLSKQPWGWWLQTPSRPLWRHTINLPVYLQEVRGEALAIQGCTIALFFFLITLVPCLSTQKRREQQPWRLVTQPNENGPFSLPTPSHCTGSSEAWSCCVPWQRIQQDVTLDSQVNLNRLLRPRYKFDVIISS